MLEVFSAVSLVVFAAALTQVTTRGRPLVSTIGMAGLAACVLATFAQIAITRGVYGSGDMFMYLQEAELLARYARVTGRVDDVFSLAFGGSPSFPFYILGVGGSTGNTAGMAALYVHFLGGTWAASFAFAMLAFSGRLAIFLALRDRVPESWQPRVLGACVLVPSLVFWTSAVMKEATTIAGLGWLVLGLHYLSRRRYGPGGLLVVAGSTFLSLSKAYMFFSLAGSVALALFWNRGIQREGESFRMSPSRMILAAVSAVVLLTLLGELFPRFAVDNIGREAAYLQGIGDKVVGGSNYAIGDENTRSLFGQLAYAPIAIVTCLFRPFPFEVRNGLMAINALETLAFVGLLLVALQRHGFGGIWSMVRKSPVLMFCASMTLMTALGVGLTTTNLGTLSRYRVPMFPFYLSLLLILARRTAPEEMRASRAQTCSVGSPIVQ